jgi:hypothetical protein
MAERSKDDVIKSVYYGVGGYGRAQSTYEKAKKKDKTITLQDVKNWFFKNVEKIEKPKGANSYINNAPLEEFQIDQFTFGNRAGENEGIAIIDVFSKVGRVYPGKNNGANTLAALMTFINDVGKPKMIYADNASTYNLVKEYCAENDIKFIITTTHPQVVERFIRTFKTMTWRRIRAPAQKRIVGKTPVKKWSDYINDVIETYNNTLHTSVGMTPNEASKKQNTLQAKVNQEMHRKKSRQYPEIKVGDYVKIYTKKKTQNAKENVSSWSDETYEVTKIETSMNQKYYYLKGYVRPLLRHDIDIAPKPR